MRADEPIQTNPYLVGGVVIETDYINQLRVDRLMAKARELKNKAYYNDAISDKKYSQCFRIAEALEARAKRIKEGM